MSLLGIDVGTTGCKATVFANEGGLLAQAYREYDLLRPQPGWAEFDSRGVWEKIKDVIKIVASRSSGDPITALSVSSCGEAMTPVSKNREILGNALLGFDKRGGEYIVRFVESLGKRHTHKINGNIPNQSFSAPKLIWYKEHRRDIYEKADYFLGWPDLIFFLLGMEPAMDFTLANRTMLFDIENENWSDALIQTAELDREKLPRIVKSGTDLGAISAGVADELGLPRNVHCVTGGHDQCCNALGAGVVKSGQSAYGIGTFICITPVFSSIPDRELFFQNNLNIEHHVIPGSYVTLISNMTGGAVLKWFRDEFSALEKKISQETGKDIYAGLISQVPNNPSRLFVLPYFAPTGSPWYESKAPGAIFGLQLDTSRWEVLKALMEGATYYFAEAVEVLRNAAVSVNEYRATGGGAKSDIWMQLKADIMGKPFARPEILEASSLGAAMLAGAATGVYDNLQQAAAQLVRIDKIFEPDTAKHVIYQEKLQKYRQMRVTLIDLAKEMF